MSSQYQYLQSITQPQDIKKISPAELECLCAEIRQFIIDEVSENPGHFGASLGTVELSVALYYIFNIPQDAIIWDVGHQAYTHKILTGRKEKFHTNRKFGGISGFPKRSESEYDVFGTGHASTSISAAVGIAMANRLNSQKQHAIAVIGDGSMGGGLAFEAMNHAGAEKLNLLVILNDNEISIDKNVGALHNYLVQLSTSAGYNQFRTKVWYSTVRFKWLRRFVKRTWTILKNLVKENNGILFKGLGFRYFGPVDGHDVKMLLKTLENLKNIDGPKLLHIRTVKGKGYKPAELSQTEWHAPGKFDKTLGTRITDRELQPPLFQDVFGKTVAQLAEMNNDIVAITPAMLTGSSLGLMMQKFPERTFDVGIAEGHAVTFSAGLAVAGKIPVCVIYSSFMQRSYDNVIHDAALQKLHILFCLDRAGLVGEDGATHHGVYDMAYFRCIPNLTMAAPRDEQMLQNMLYSAVKHPATYIIRYPKGRGRKIDWETPLAEHEFGRIEQLHGDIVPTNIAIFSIGTAAYNVSDAIKLLETENIGITHYNLTGLKPVDKKMLHKICAVHQKAITVEDGTVIGGLGSLIAEFCQQNHYSLRFINLGVPDEFVEHGTIMELQKLCGFDAQSIADVCRKLWND